MEKKQGELPPPPPNTEFHRRCEQFLKVEEAVGVFRYFLGYVAWLPFVCAASWASLSLPSKNTS